MERTLPHLDKLMVTSATYCNRVLRNCHFLFRIIFTGLNYIYHARRILVNLCYAANTARVINQEA